MGIYPFVECDRKILGSLPRIPRKESARTWRIIPRPQIHQLSVIPLTLSNCQTSLFAQPPGGTLDAPARVRSKLLTRRFVHVIRNRGVPEMAQAPCAAQQHPHPLQQ
jgi:hypothetical protein